MDRRNKLFEIASNRMFSALNAFYIWKIIGQSINIHQEGGEEKANENLEWIINKYPSFFQQTIINSYKTFVCDLAIFFDAGKYESFSLHKLIEIASEKENNLLEIKSQIQEIKKPHGKLISLIIRLRNQDVAHQALNPEQHHIIYKEVEDLFVAVQKILNLLSEYHDRSWTVWDHLEKEMEGDISWIFENLKRGEKQRLKGIE